MGFDSATDLDVTLAPTSAWLPAVAAPARLERHTEASPQRATLEAFIHRQFFVHFNARVTQFMPELLALRARDGELRAVVGCRSARRERLFLETYTQEPIERVLSRHTGYDVARSQIVEIGSLACRSASGAIAIVQALIPHLLAAGFSWVAFTGATTVMRVFQHLGLAPEPLCKADPALLGEARHAWGSYYDHSPHVMAGRIIDGAAATRERRAPRLPQ